MRNYRDSEEETNSVPTSREITEPMILQSEPRVTSLLTLLDDCPNLGKSMCKGALRTLDRNWTEGHNFSQSAELKIAIAAKIPYILRAILPTLSTEIKWFERYLFVKQLGLKMLPIFPVDLRCKEFLKMLNVVVDFDGAAVSRLTGLIYPKILRKKGEGTRYVVYKKLYIHVQNHNLGKWISNIYIPGVPDNRSYKKEELVFDGDLDSLKAKGYIALRPYYPQLEALFVDQCKIRRSLSSRKISHMSNQEMPDFIPLHVSRDFEDKDTLRDLTGRMAERYAYETLCSWVKAGSEGRRKFDPMYWVSSARSSMFPEMADTVDDTLGYDMYFDDDAGLIPENGVMSDGKGRTQKMIYMFEVKGHWTEKYTFHVTCNEWEIARRSSSRFTSEYRYVIIGIVVTPQLRLLYWIEDPYEMYCQRKLKYDDAAGVVYGFRGMCNNFFRVKR